MGFFWRFRPIVNKMARYLSRNQIWQSLTEWQRTTTVCRGSVWLKVTSLIRMKLSRILRCGRHNNPQCWQEFLDPREKTTTNKKCEFYKGLKGLFSSRPHTRGTHLSHSWSLYCSLCEQSYSQRRDDLALTTMAKPVSSCVVSVMWRGLSAGQCEAGVWRDKSAVQKRRRWELCVLPSQKWRRRKRPGSTISGQWSNLAVSKKVWKLKFENTVWLKATAAPQ